MPSVPDVRELLSVIVYDQGFIEAQRRRAAGRPDWERSAIHDVICSESKAALREWIEREVQRLSEPGRERLAARLRLERAFVPAVHELAVAAVLADCGLSPIYEEKLEGQTPDLFVPGDGSRRPLIIEVWTREMAQGARSDERAWGALRARIERIPVPVGLLVERRGRIRAPSPGQAKAHAARLREWLLSADRAPGSRIELDGFRYLVHGSVPGLCARLPSQHSGGAYDSSEVLAAIAAKVTRYRDLANALDADLLVVVGADVRAPLTLDLARSALTGDNSVSMSWAAGQTGYIGEWNTPIGDKRRPEFDPALSAAGWIEVRDGDPGLHIFPVDTARARLLLDGPRVTWDPDPSA